MREEDDSLLIISEVVVCLEVVHDLVVVHLTSHQIPLDQTASIVYSGSVFGDVTESDESVGEVSEERKSALQAQVKHAFRMVEPKSSSLSATHNAHSNFSLGDGHVAQLVELSRLCLKVLMGGNIADRRKLVLLILLKRRLLNIDMLVELSSLIEIHVF